MSSITIPNSVTNISGAAFEGCSSLESVTLPDSIDSVNSETFYGCSSLESITIPDSVTYIGSSAFSYCSGLKSVTIPESVTYIDYSAFDECHDLTIYGVKGSYAESYANDNDIPFVSIGDDNPDDPKPAYSGVFGDVFGDGTVDSADALIVLRASVELEEFDEKQQYFADVNGDGEVDTADSLYILRYSVGIKDNGIKTGEIVNA